MVISVNSRVPSAAGNGKHGHTLISDDKFRQLYTLTLKMRLMAEGGDTWLRDKEAILAGVAADLRAQDFVLLEPGMSRAGALRETLPGALVGAAAPPEDALIETVGCAVAARIRKNGGIGVVFCTEAVREAVLREVRELAVRGNLPLLFVEYSEDSGSDSRKVTARNGAGEKELPVIPVDRQDVVAMYRVAHESIARAREGSGPTRIQCVEWQPAGSARQRLAVRRDSVEQLERWLEGRGLPAHEWRQQIVAEALLRGPELRESGVRGNSAAAELWNEREARPPQSIA